jgi:hypothetical protein
MNRLLVLLACLMEMLCATAQLNPKPRAKLNYNQVMFDCTKVKGAGMYVFQLAEDTTGASFEHVLLEQKDSAPATLISGLQFGKKYQWRYAGLVKGQAPVWRGPWHFEITTDPLLQYGLINFDVLKNEAGNNAGGLIINDCTHTIVDRNGNMVWYLPKINWHPIMVKKNIEIKPQIFDLRLNPCGTITYLANALADETDLDGNNLWKGPDNGEVSGGSTELYNHDFKRVANGHYMLLGGEQWRKLPAYKDTAGFFKKYPSRKIIDGHEYGEVEFPTLIEYDKKGKVIWSWKGEDYFDPDAFDTTKGIFELKPHVNAFSVDQKDEFVYIGFRNVSRIVKIEKKTGKVVDSWGDKTSVRMPARFVGLHRQHDANILNDGTIAVFNNNDYPGLDSFASVLLISQREEDSSNNYVAWSFSCDLDSLNRHDERNGGNVDQLPNGNFLVCMGNMNRIFEVTRNKKIVWDAALVPEGKAGNNFFHRLYRAHYISSLYPCYFTFVTNEDVLQAGPPHIQLKIFNKGSESDTYQVKMNSASGNYLADITTETVPANSSLNVNVKSDHPLKGGDLVEVVVSSKTNPDFVRRSLLTVAK